MARMHVCRRLSFSCTSIGSVRVGQHNTADSLLKQTVFMPLRLLQNGTFSACCCSAAVDLPVDELADRSSCHVGFLVSAGVTGLGAAFLLVTSFAITSSDGLPAAPALILPVTGGWVFDCKDLE